MNLRVLTKCAVALSLVITAAPALAQAGGQNNPGQFNRLNNRNQRPQPKRNYLVELRGIVDAIAKRTETKIVVDPGMFVAALPKAPADELTVDRALDQISGLIKGSSWRKVYLQQTGSTLTPAADKLVLSVRTLDQMEQSGLVLENPATKKATTFLKNYAVSPTFTEELQAGQFQTKPVYVLYALAESADGKSPQDRFADLQRQQMEMMMQMSPEEMSQAMQASMQSFMNMDPQMRQQMMGNMMRAGTMMFQNMPADQRNQLLQGIGGPGGIGGFPGGPGGPPRQGGSPR